MELRHLRYFVAIGEEQHYGRAARSLRVAQPALSRQIQDLEQELGFELFERLQKRLSLIEEKLYFRSAHFPWDVLGKVSFVFLHDTVEPVHIVRPIG